MARGGVFQSCWVKSAQRFWITCNETLKPLDRVLYASEPHANSFQERDDQGLLKAELFGKLGPAAPATLNGRKLLQDLPPRLSQFVAAFKKLNEKLFNNFDTLLRRAIASRLHTGNGDKNSEHLTKEASSLWWGSAGSIQVMRPTSRADSRHIDGRAGILHAGVSVFGERLGWHCFHASFRSCGAETFFLGPRGQRLMISELIQRLFFVGCCLVSTSYPSRRTYGNRSN